MKEKLNQHNHVCPLLCCSLCLDRAITGSRFQVAAQFCSDFSLISFCQFILHLPLKWLILHHHARSVCLLEPHVPVETSRPAVQRPASPACLSPACLPLCQYHRRQTFLLRPWWLRLPRLVERTNWSRPSSVGPETLAQRLEEPLTVSRDSRASAPAQEGSRHKVSERGARRLPAAPGGRITRVRSQESC